MLMVLVNGFANAGTTIAKATKSAAIRYFEFGFMRVTCSLSLSTEFEPQGLGFEGS
jgi:hypothetical protein